MFETAVQEKRTGMLWGVIMGVVALAVLLGTGYSHRLIPWVRTPEQNHYQAMIWHDLGITHQTA